MSYTDKKIAELDLLMRFDSSNSQTGIKIHKTATPDAIAAAHSLFDKGLITQDDGGYLTDLGKQAADHAHALATMLD